MKGDPSDGELGTRFAELREADARAAPPFGTVWGGAAAGAAARRAPRRVRAMTAAAVLLIVAGGALLMVLRRPWPPARAPVAVSSWRSPTDFLLRGPGDDMLRSVPTISGSVLRLDTPWRER